MRTVVGDALSVLVPKPWLAPLPPDRLPGLEWSRLTGRNAQPLRSAEGTPTDTSEGTAVPASRRIRHPVRERRRTASGSEADRGRWDVRVRARPRRLSTRIPRSLSAPLLLAALRRLPLLQA